jgi:hypothetical protein
MTRIASPEGVKKAAAHGKAPRLRAFSPGRQTRASIAGRRGQCTADRDVTAGGGEPASPGCRWRMACTGRRCCSAAVGWCKSFKAIPG